MMNQIPKRPVGVPNLKKFIFFALATTAITIFMRKTSVSYEYHKYPKEWQGPPKKEYVQRLGTNFFNIF